MNNKDLVSVVVPVYNVEKYLRTCIDSLLCQTYKNIKIIIVNDGSPDNSQNIVNEYLEKHNDKIISLVKENGGLSDARNYGLKYVESEYVCFVDSDDAVDSRMVESMINAMKETVSEVCICDCKTFKDKLPSEEETTKKEYEIMSNLESISKMFYQKKYDTSAWAKMYKTSLITDIEFPKGKYYEDLFTTYKILIKANKVVFINNKFYFYRKNIDGIMHKKFNENSLDMLEAINEIEHFFKDSDALSNSIKSRKFSVCCQLLKLIQYNYITNKSYKTDDMRNFICKNKKEILCDKNARLKNRIAAALAFFGKNVFVSVLKLM